MHQLRRQNRRSAIRVTLAVTVAAWCSCPCGATAGDPNAGRRTDAQPAVPIETLRKGTSSRNERSSAQKRIPLSRLAPQYRERANHILKSAALFRSLPVQRFVIDPDVYRYFIRHPDSAVSIWRVLEISRFQMWQTGPRQYEAETGDGSYGVIDVALRSDNESVVLCDGAYKSPLMSKPIKAHGLLHLVSRHGTDREGKPIVTQYVNVFVSFPSQPVKAVAKIISPVTNLIMDRNLLEISAFAQMMSVAVDKQPGWVETVAGRMDGILESSRSELMELAAKSRERRVSAAGPGATGAEAKGVDHIFQPLRVSAAAVVREGSLIRKPIRTAALKPVPLRRKIETEPGTGGRQ